MVERIMHTFLQVVLCLNMALVLLDCNLSKGIRVMNTSTVERRPLFREKEGVIPNTLVLAWTSLAWIMSFRLMGVDKIALNTLGVLLSVHTMILAAYLVHEAAHATLFSSLPANRRIGEWMSFIAGSCYASFDRIRHMHIRHHRDRADVTCFDFKGLMQRHPLIRRALFMLEWAYIPATGVVMHLQVVWRPFFVRSQRKFLKRSALTLVLRGALLAALAIWSVKAVFLYILSYGIFLHVLNFFDAFHHTFDQYFVEAEEPLPPHFRDRKYEQDNTYSNVISTDLRIPNLLTLNFGYHNAHHERASVPWYRLPIMHQELYGETHQAVMPLKELMVTWHRNRVSRVYSANYGVPGQGEGRANSFVGAHGVSFLTVI
jgi:fatty acid desaturase